jgi:nucleotide-binding universal stress UspA family protein
MRIAEKTAKPATLKTILFATDFSPASNRAQGYATGLATRFRAKLVVMHATGPRNYAVPPETWPEDDQAATRVRKLKESISNSVAGIQAETRLSEGSAWDAVNSFAAETQVDLLVLGTRGREGVSKLLLGSQAEEIFRRAHCPVLTVGPNSKQMGDGGNQLSEILYATDFSPESLAAVPYAVSFALALQARLTLLHVIKKTGGTQQAQVEQLRLSCTRLLRSLVPEETEFWQEPQWIVEEGAPADKILEVAGQKRSGLIVLGVRKPTEIAAGAAHFSSGVAHKVVIGAECPVLTVRG